MRLVTYTDDTGTHAGVLVDDRVCRLSEVTARISGEPITSARAIFTAADS